MPRDGRLPKSAWGPGPWQYEPDRVEFRHVGFPCILSRSDVTGAWCGYVGVPPGHPWHSKGTSDLEDLSVHGGITYAEPCNEIICHRPEPGESDDVWWLGFDFAHAYDFTPAIAAHFARRPGRLERYHTQAEAGVETRSLAEQALAMKP